MLNLFAYVSCFLKGWIHIQWSLNLTISCVNDDDHINDYVTPLFYTGISLTQERMFHDTNNNNKVNKKAE